jgi:hypothetical protein
MRCWPSVTRWLNSQTPDVTLTAAKLYCFKEQKTAKQRGQLCGEPKSLQRFTFRRLIGTAPLGGQGIRRFSLMETTIFP